MNVDKKKNACLSNAGKSSGDYENAYEDMCIYVYIYKHGDTFKSVKILAGCLS